MEFEIIESMTISRLLTKPKATSPKSTRHPFRTPAPRISDSGVSFAATDRFSAPSQGMQSRFATLDRDVSGARVWQGPSASRMAADLGAQAFSVGRDVVLGDEHEPSRHASQRVLAHELAHTTQRTGGLVARRVLLATPKKVSDAPLAPGEDTYSYYVDQSDTMMTIGKNLYSLWRKAADPDHRSTITAEYAAKAIVAYNRDFFRISLARCLAALGSRPLRACSMVSSAMPAGPLTPAILAAACSGEDARLMTSMAA